MKRRVIFEITATAVLCFALGGIAVWASRDGGDETGSTRGTFSQQGGAALPRATWEPTQDPYHLPEIPAEYHLYWVGPHRCYLPEGASPVLSAQASTKGGRVLGDGTHAYYVTASGRCVTFEGPQPSQAGWISSPLEERLDTTDDAIWPCLVSDNAVEVLNRAAAQAGGRVFDDGSGREYVTADGRCVNISAPNPPDWLSPEFEAKMSDPSLNSDNFNTPYPTQAVATFVAHRTAIAAADGEGQ